MQLIAASNDEKRSVHLTRLVRQLTFDQRRGTEHLPDSMFQRLKALQTAFREKRRLTRRNIGLKTMAIDARNQTTRRLSHLVRDVYIMAKRKFDRGEIGAEVMALHHVPKGSLRDNERKSGLWIERAHFLIDGDLEYTEHSPTLLRDPTRSELSEALEAAENALGDANLAIDNYSTLQTELKIMRQEVDQLLAKARFSLVGSYYELPEPALRECLYAYGYRFRRKKPMKEDPMETPEAMMREKQTSATESGKPAVRKPKAKPRKQAFQYAPTHGIQHGRKHQDTLLAPKVAVPHKPQDATVGEVGACQDSPAQPTPTPKAERPAIPEIAQKTPTPEAERPKTVERPQPAPKAELAEPLVVDTAPPEPRQMRVPTDPDLRDAITIPSPEKEKTNTAAAKVAADAAKRKAAFLAKHGGQKPKRKKRPSKSKKNK